jgi:hypothetical protein
MAAALEVREKQRALVEFLCCENEIMGSIHKRLKNVYGDANYVYCCFVAWQPFNASSDHYAELWQQITEHLSYQQECNNK